MGPARIARAQGHRRRWFCENGPTSRVDAAYGPAPGQADPGYLCPPKCRQNARMGVCGAGPLLRVLPSLKTTKTAAGELKIPRNVYFRKSFINNDLRDFRAVSDKWPRK